ncbi:Cystathionine beta-lyase [Clostridiaceae bacterium JG1575]|nr:Cystathionine beta-lyase [Clostridiaceae bacterium JG1575]
MEQAFLTAPNRRGTGAYKWDQMDEWNPQVAQGVIPYSVADMELMNPPVIGEAVAAYVKENVLGYTGPTQAYREAVASWMARRHQWTVPLDAIVPFPGVVPALYNAVRAFSSPGDGVIIQPPVYYPFRTAIEGSGRCVVANPLLEEDASYRMNLSQLEELAKDPANTLMILCSPHNPVGRVWSEEELLAVYRICRENGVFLVCDEIHHDLVLKGHRHRPLASLIGPEAKGLMTATAPSKTFNLAGYVASNIIIMDPQERQAFQEEARLSGVGMVNALGYVAAKAAYNEAEDWLEGFLELLQENERTARAYVKEHLPMIRVAPLEGTYLLWMDCSALGFNAQELEAWLHKKAEVFFDEGILFGEEGALWERMNLACPTAKILEALARIQEALLAQ